MEPKSPNRFVGNINIINTTRDSPMPSLEYSESPLSKRRNDTDFPTEETSHIRSPCSPFTASSTLPFPKETLYDKVKETLLHNRLTKKLQHLRQKSESLRISTQQSKSGYIDEEVKLTEATEPYELEISNDTPTLVWCAYCQGERRTEVQYVNSSKTFWSAVGIFLVGGVAGCFLLPYMTNNCKNSQMVCSRCRRKLNA